MAGNKCILTVNGDSDRPLVIATLVLDLRATRVLAVILPRDVADLESVRFN